MLDFFQNLTTICQILMVKSEESAEETSDVGQSCTNEQTCLKTRRQVWVPQRDRCQANSKRRYRKVNKVNRFMISSLANFSTKSNSRGCGEELPWLLWVLRGHSRQRDEAL